MFVVSYGERMFRVVRYLRYAGFFRKRINFLWNCFVDVFSFELFCSIFFKCLDVVVDVDV